MLRRFAFRIILTAWLATSLAGLSAQENSLTPFREAHLDEIQRLNPLLAPPNSSEAAITSLLFEGLFTLNRFGEIVPQLAEDWYISKNGLEYVIWLRGHGQMSDNSGQPPARWHDGQPLRAVDVALTMSLLRGRNFPGNPQLGAFWQTVETTVLSEYALRFRLTQPLASFLDALRIAILPEHALRGVTAAELPAHPFNLDPIGSGPYQLEALRSSVAGSITQVELRRAPNYAERAEAPYAIEHIHFQRYPNLASIKEAFLQGRVDGYASRNLAERAALLDMPNEQATLQQTLAPQLGCLLFQWQHSDLAELSVRRALVAGLDVEKLVAETLANMAIVNHSPLPANSWASAASAPLGKGDAAAAREALAVVRPDLDEDGYRLRLRLLTPEENPFPALASKIARQYASLDVLVEIDAQPTAEYVRALAESDFALALIEWDFSGSADPDVYSFWHEGQSADAGGQNYGAVSDRRISEALEHARQDANGLHRRAHYANFQEAFIQQAAAIPLYTPLFTYLTGPRVVGLQQSYLDSHSARFREIGRWSLATTEQ